MPKNTRENTRTVERIWRLSWLLGWVALFASIGLPLALDRHFHVDELTYAFDIVLLDSEQPNLYIHYVTPLFVPLSWLTSMWDSSQAILLTLRIAFLGLLAANLLLIALGQPWLTRPGQRAMVLFAATTVVPLWRHGLEIRPETLVLTGLLVLHGITQSELRQHRHRLNSFLGLGFVAAILQATWTDSWMIWSSSSLFLLLVTSLRQPASPIRFASQATTRFFVGTVLGLVVVTVFLVSSGRLERYLELVGIQELTSVPMLDLSNDLRDLLGQIPLFAAFCAGSLGLLFLPGAEKAPHRFQPIHVTWLYLLAILTVIGVSPNNPRTELLYVVPFIFLTSIYTAKALWNRLENAGPAVLGVLLLSSLLHSSWAVKSDRYMTTSNQTQLSYINAAEALTGPTDPVFDGIGMVAARPPHNADWLVRKQQLTPIGRVDSEGFAPVLLPNHRWAPLSNEQEAWLRQHYIELYPGLLLLGQQHHRKSGQFKITYPGRYAVEAPGGMQIDGLRHAHGDILPFSPGTYSFENDSSLLFTIRWLGPRLSQAPYMGEITTAQPLFLAP